jgi:hypothetical protein
MYGYLCVHLLLKCWILATYFMICWGYDGWFIFHIYIDGLAYIMWLWQFILWMSSVLAFVYIMRPLISCPIDRHGRPLVVTMFEMHCGC